MANEKGNAAATTPAAGGDGANDSEDLAFLNVLEAEEAAGRTAESTNDSQGSTTGSPGGDTTTEEDDGAEDDVDAELDEDSASGDTDTAAEDTEGEEGDGEECEEAEDESGEFKGRVQKRINKLTAKVKTLAERNAELEDELKSLRDGAPPTQGPWDPLAGDQDYAQSRKTEEQAHAEYKGARQLLRNLDRTPDKVLELVAKAFKVEDPTPDQARDLLEDYAERQQERLTEAKTKRAAREAELRQVNAQAGQVWQREAEADMPWLKNPDDNRQKHVKAILKAHPWVKQVPAGAWIVAAAAHKLAVMEARSRAAQKAPRNTSGGERRIVPTNGRTTAANARTPARGEKRYAEAAKRHLENPDDDALIELLDAAVGG